MNIYELVRLAGEASGGGVSYSVSYTFSSLGNGKQAPDVSVFRWDSVNRSGITYNDVNHRHMKDTDMAMNYRPLKEALLVMHRDAEALAPGYTITQIRANATGIKTRREVIEFIRQYTAERGFPPARIDIVRGTRVTGGSSFDRILRDMRDAGLISYDSGKARSFKINEKAVSEWLNAQRTT